MKKTERMLIVLFLPLLRCIAAVSFVQMSHSRSNVRECELGSCMLVQPVNDHVMCLIGVHCNALM